MSLIINNFNVVEDGFLQLGDNIANISFHQNLNVLIATTKTNRIRIFDPHSSTELADIPQNDLIQKSNESSGSIQCTYLSKTGAVIFCGGKIVSLRQDHQGVLLLNSLLQTKVSNWNEIVTLELLLSEAWQLQQSFKDIKLDILSSEGKEVVDVLDKAIAGLASKNSLNSKVAKWKTVCLKLSLKTLSLACFGLSNEYKRLGIKDPSLPLASALSDRLTQFMNNHYLEISETVERENMFSESTRLATFYKWPHMNYKWALPEQMAQAGFFHQPVSESDDRAMCFICNVCLVYWEPTDEPWSEHERHSPNCPFVRGEFTHNVPLSVTCAAYPALKHADIDEFASLSSGNSAKLIATFTESGLIVIWNTSKQLKKEVTFPIDPSDQIIFNKHFSNCSAFSDIPICPEFKQLLYHHEFDDLPPLELDLDQSNQNASQLYNMYKEPVDLVVPLTPSHDLKVTAASVVCEPGSAGRNNKSSKTSLIVGTAMRRYIWANLLKESMESMNSSLISEIQELNIVNLSSTEQLVEQDDLDIMLLKENEKDTQTYSDDTPAGAAKFGEALGPAEESSFLPYLLIYDLNKLAKEQFQAQPSSSVISHGKGSSKKTTSLFSQEQNLDSLHILNSENTVNSQNTIKYGAKQSMIIEDKLPITVSDTKKNSPICTQCIKLPQKYFKPGASFIVNNVLPTPCGNYILTSVINTKSLRAKSPPGFVFLFKIDNSETNIRLFENPVLIKECDGLKSVPERIIFIPTVMEDNSIHSVVAACVTADGSFIVLSLLTLETIFQNCSNDSVYNDVVYCNSTERICVTEECGKTAIFHIVNQDSYEEQEALSFKVVSALCDPNIELNMNGKDVEVQSNELLVNQEIDEENLSRCLRLTHFAPGSPRFVSTMAPCWVEIMQAQKQRRNPQHLHQKVGEGDLTRTWRLRGDLTTKDEHLLDLLFPPCGGTGTGGGLQIGHIDVKINFHDQTTTLPQIQITLLKQNLSNPSKQSIHIEESGADGTKLFLDEHSEDILCGPVIINNYMDLSGSVATVALTSPGLMACRSRSYLLHLKALNSKPVLDKSHPTELNIVGQYIPLNQSSSTRSSGAPDSLQGCNVINDLSIKVYTCKKTNLAHDRLQRLALLEKESFHELLLKIAIDLSSSIHSCNCSMDLFLWILTVHLTSQYKKVENIITILQQKLPNLIKNCILLGDRSLARKAVKIILVAFDNLDNKAGRMAFGIQVLYGLLENSDEILQCRSAGALNHYFSLLNHVKWCDLEKTSSKITALLSSVASSVSQMNNPLHYLLQTKFNLHGLPFERQMFDNVPYVLPKHALKPTPPTMPPPYNVNQSYLGEGGMKATAMQWKQNAMNIPHSTPSASWGKYIYENNFDSDIPTNKGKIVRREQLDSEASAIQQTAGLCGLLEVEPLHFSLHTSSEGTKMEKVVPGSSYVGNPLFMYPFHGEIYGSNYNSDVHDQLYQLEEDAKLLGKFFSSQNGQHSQSEESLSATPEDQYLGTEAETAAILLEVLEHEKHHHAAITEVVPVDSPIDMDLFAGNSDQEKATTEVKSDTMKRRSSPPYMLSLPPQHILVIDRMHSGARRFVVLDFGYPVVLTDVIIPACRDLVSLTLDIWLISEEQDGERLAVANDIGVKPIILSDLQPPPFCRFLKITTLGRYGMVSSNIKIPVGLFYGHSFVFPWNLQMTTNNVNFITKQEAQHQITVLRSMMDDLGFRYSLSCSKLKALLNPLLMKMSLNTEFSSSSCNLSGSDTDNKPFVDIDSEKSIHQAYQECIVEQHHLNLVVAVLERLEHFMDCNQPFGMRIAIKKQDTSLDQLSTVLQYLINCLLEMSVLPSDLKIPQNLIAWCKPSVARSLISEVCLQGPRQTLFSTTAALISRLCVIQSWWGDFLGELAVSLFKIGHDQKFSAIRIYSLLCLLGQRSCESGKGREIINAIVDSCLGLLTGVDSSLDMPLIWWVLLFLSGCLDITLGSNSTQRSSSENRWTWIGAENLLQEKTTNQSKSAPQQIGAREKLRKRLSYHRQKLVSLETATKSFGEVLAGLGSWGSNPKVVRESQAAFSRLQRQHALKHFKDLCSIRRHETTTLSRTAKLPIKQEDNCRETSPATYSTKAIYMTPIARNRALEACRRLVRLLVSSNRVEIDSFMLTCKVIGELARSVKPSLHLGDILTQTTLESLLCQTLFVDSVSGGQWAMHSLSCLLQDIIEGELLYGRETNIEDEIITEEILEDDISENNDEEINPSRTLREDDECQKNIGCNEAEGANQLAVLNSPPLVNLATSRSANVQEDDVMGILSDNFSKLVNCDSDSSSGDEDEDQTWAMLNNSMLHSDEVVPQYPNCISISLAGALKVAVPAKIFPAKGVKTINKADQTDPLENSTDGDFEHSSALDCRSEMGLLLNVELRMIMMNSIHSSKIAKALSDPVQAISGAPSVITYKCGDLSDSVELLSTVFQKALTRISIQGDYKRLESLLEMWINLNMEAVTEQVGRTGPLIPLCKTGISAILSTVSRWGTINVRGWYLILQSLSMCCTHDNFSQSTNGPSLPETFDDNNLNCLAWVIATDQNFLAVLIKLFSVNFSSSCNTSDIRIKSDMLGSTVTSILENFLLRMVFRCNMMPCHESHNKENPKVLLLKLLLRLLEPGAALRDGIGALDAQKTLLDVLLSFSYDDVQSKYLILSIINSVAPVVHNYISCSESKIFDSIDASMLFASVLGCESKQAQPITRQVLMCSLVNLCTKMLLIPVNQTVSPLRLLQPAYSSSQTDELKAMRTPSVRSKSTIDGLACSHSSNAVSYLVDEVLKNQQTMQLLIESLGKVQGSSIMVALGGVCWDLSEKISQGETFTDALYRLLLFINMKTTRLDTLLTAIIQFLTPGDAWSQPCLSELLFCYLSQVLDCTNVLKQFSELGGFELLWTNLVKSVKWAGSGQISSSESSIVSTVLNQLNLTMPSVTTNFSSSKTVESEVVKNYGGSGFQPPKPKADVLDVNRFKGLYNFAPLAVISSSNHSARPADCLLQSSVNHFQRTKSNVGGAPPWSYHFYPYENWVDLILTLPCSVMLHEVHLCPHAFSTITCPSAVSIETGVDVSCLTPVTGQILTAGMTSILIVLPEPVVASIVIIRLIRPLDHSTLCLAQIKLLGTTALKTIPRQMVLRENGIVPPKTSIWWLRMIHHCLYEVEGGKPYGIQSALKVENAMTILVDLLCQAEGECNWQENQVDTPLEKIAVILAESNQQLRTEILERLLNHPVITLFTAVSQDTAITLLYQICINDPSTDSVRILLYWLEGMMEETLVSTRCSLKQMEKSHLNPLLLQCVATVIWKCPLDISNLMSEDLLKKTYDYYQLMDSDSSERVSQILCSMCMVNPTLFLKLLLLMGILTVKESNPQDVEIDQETPNLQSYCTDDMKESMDGPYGEGRYQLQEKGDIVINNHILRTLSIVAQSPQIASILLDSGFPILLVKGILEWCKSELLRVVERESSTDQEKTDRCQELNKDTASGFNLETVAASLDVFVLLSQQPSIKEWLGSREGSVFWVPLVNVLGDPIVRDSEAPLHSSRFCNANLYTRIEDSTISLMKSCALFHEQNQKHLASVLCQLIQRQKNHSAGGITFLHSLSGFTRRLVLQVLLEKEYIAVNIITSEGSFKSSKATTTSPFLPQPQDGIGHRNKLLYLPVSTTIEELITTVTAHWQIKPINVGASVSDQNDEDSHSQKRELGTVGLELVDKLSMAAGGVKRIKNLKNKYHNKNRKLNKKESSSGNQTGSQFGQFSFCNEYIHEGKRPLPVKMSLGQVLARIHTIEKMATRITFSLVRKNKLKEVSQKSKLDLLLKLNPVPSLMESFTCHGVLSILAERMSLLYPDNTNQLGNLATPNSNCILGAPPSVNVVIPPHSLGAFTLFLRLPGYPEAMLNDSIDACSILRIALGATISAPEEKRGYTLATLPFQVLETLLASMPLTTDDGQMLRRTCLKVGAVHLILACLVALSHQETAEIITALHHPNVPIGLMIATARTACFNQNIDSSTNQSKAERDRCFYWAKGTGFGTGSTSQYWNVEHSLQKQQMEEQHIVWMLRLLSQYIYPVFVSSNTVTPERHDEPTEFSDSEENFDVPEPQNAGEDGMPVEVFTLFQTSGLISKISLYLANDSVLDMSRHVPLYRALMDLIKGIALSPLLMPLLHDGWNGSSQYNLPALLAKMLVTVNIYMSKLTTKGSRSAEIMPAMKAVPTMNVESVEESEGEEGLALLLPHIRTAAGLVKKCMSKLKPDLCTNSQDNEPKTVLQTAFEAYSTALKPLQFDVFDMIVEDVDGKLLFTVPYSYENLTRNSCDPIPFPKKRLKRLAQEVVTLSSSLPLSLSSSVFVRTDADRLDIMKVLITGPEDTPYANGCFEFDVFFPSDYPSSPLLIKLQTTGEKKVRFNPNLYKDGKICLSILNTWHGRPEEKWNPNTSSLLQVLVSIQSLILVAEPYFNEPGYERSRGTPGGIAKSKEYDANIRLATVRWAILNQLRHPSSCFKEIIQKHFYQKSAQVMQTLQLWINEMEAMKSANYRTIAHHLRKLRNLIMVEIAQLNLRELGDTAGAVTEQKLVNVENQSAEDAVDLNFSNLESVDQPSVNESTYSAEKLFTINTPEMTSPYSMSNNFQFPIETTDAGNELSITNSYAVSGIIDPANDEIYLGENMPDDVLQDVDWSHEIFDPSPNTWEPDPKKEL